MLKTVPAQDLRIRLGEYLDRADLSGDAFVVTRGDRPKAVLLGAAQYVEIVERIEALEAGHTAQARQAGSADERVVTTEKLRALLR
jgi:prevent-host-death family protein